MFFSIAGIVTIGPLSCLVTKSEEREGSWLSNAIDEIYIMENSNLGCLNSFYKGHVYLDEMGKGYDLHQAFICVLSRKIFLHFWSCRQTRKWVEISK